MEWWTHLWLNEGFASFMETICTDYLFPEFKILLQFLVDTLIPALELDAMDSSHPIEVEVGHPDEVDEIFDNISYNKGASVIRMLYDYLGASDFRKGMKTYLERFSYANAQTEDLWKALEEASGKPVGRVMGTWTSQMGFPMVSVLSTRQEGDETVLVVAQEKFCSSRSTKSNAKWCVPIKVLTSEAGAAPQSFLLEEDKAELRVANKNKGWVKLNHEFLGFYRVLYKEEAALKNIIGSFPKLNELDQVNLLDDAVALAQSGR